ncbi:MAG: 2-oxo acid dehydrogenase subunit E2, partial [Myxococcales bacterium]|nr:2-oxo acid dehydrogenase subunit E2 [Myxococcales bacterium]
MPRLSDTMEEGVVAKWRIAVGDKVKRGQVIAEIETDKATMEFESFDAGYVLKLVAEEGETLALGAPIAVLGKAGEDPAAALSAHGGGGAAAAPAEAPEPAAASPAVELEAAPAAAEPAPASEPVAISADDQRIPASPLARRLVREHGLELAAISGTGPHGRVIKADVERAVAEGTGKRAPAAAASGAAAAASYSAELDGWGRPYASHGDEPIKLSQMRKTIARRMTQAKQETPHYYLTVDVDMEKATSFRADYNQAIEASGTKVSFNDLIVKAVARALRAYPAVNVSWNDGKPVRRGDVHVGVAVAVDDGLVVPVVRFADQKSLEAIAVETRGYALRARDKQLRPEEMSGGTFTVSNLGMFGIEEFSAVINPGEPGIL